MIFFRSLENLFCYFYFPIRIFKKRLNLQFNKKISSCNFLKIENLLKLPNNDPLQGSNLFQNQ